MKGGTPGAYPSFEDIPLHKMPNLYDPLGIAAKNSPEKKAKGLLMEINNGRLAVRHPPINARVIARHHTRNRNHNAQRAHKRLSAPLPCCHCVFGADDWHHGFRVGEQGAGLGAGDRGPHQAVCR